MKSKTTLWQGWTASVRGPLHEHLGLPNQDSSLITITKDFALAVVADGLGSKANAELGAKCACKAVLQAQKTGSRLRQMKN